jgi:hypothetical protein
MSQKARAWFVAAGWSQPILASFIGGCDHINLAEISDWGEQEGFSRDLCDSHFGNNFLIGGCGNGQQAPSSPGIPSTPAEDSAQLSQPAGTHSRG